MSQATEAEVLEGEVIDNESLGALATISSAELDTQIVTARRFPRSVTAFREEAMSLATLDEATALECMYALPRSGKTIEGPSARMAEILVSSWGNCRAGARVVDIGEKYVTAQGVFFDLQRNSSTQAEVQRRITNRSGTRFNDDMVGVACNAACSIALRNAVLKGIPKAVWRPIYDAARKTAVGDIRTLSTRRAQALAWFAQVGASEEMVLELLELSGVEDITLDHLAALQGLRSGIKSGETSVESAFAPSAGSTGARTAKSKLNERLNAGKAASTPPTPPKAEKAEEPPAEPVEPEPAASPANNEPPTPEELAANGQGSLLGDDENNSYYDEGG